MVIVHKSPSGQWAHFFTQLLEQMGTMKNTDFVEEGPGRFYLLAFIFSFVEDYHKSDISLQHCFVVYLTRKRLGKRTMESNEPGIQVTQKQRIQCAVRWRDLFPRFLGNPSLA